MPETGEEEWYRESFLFPEVEDWHQRFLLGAENALRARPKDDEALKEEQIKKLKQKIGELVVDADILREALKPYPLARGTSDE